MTYNLTHLLNALEAALEHAEDRGVAAETPEEGAAWREVVKRLQREIHAVRYGR